METLSLKQIQSILLDILLDIDRFCRENGLRYAIGYGTLLGAVRYGDFIPWDDDADIIMPREDFERFLATYPDGRYRCLYNTDRKGECFISGFAKVHDPRTDKFVGNRKYRNHYGVSVDIFPLDPLPEDETQRRQLISRGMHYGRRLACYGKRLFHGSPLLMIESRLRSRDYWFRKCQEVCRSVKPEESSLYGVIMGARGYHNVHPNTLLDQPAEIELAGHKFLCPKDTDAYLRQIYGPDYIIPPPENKRTGHGDPVYRV